MSCMINDRHASKKENCSHTQMKDIQTTTVHFSHFKEIGMMELIWFMAVWLHGHKVNAHAWVSTKDFFIFF